MKKFQGTGKSLSEALIFASTNPQYDNRLFIELQVQYVKIPSSNLGRTCCVQKLFLTFRTIFVHNMFSPCSAKRRVSDKDLPVIEIAHRRPYIQWLIHGTLPLFCRQKCVQHSLQMQCTQWGLTLCRKVAVFVHR